MYPMNWDPTFLFFARPSLAALMAPLVGGQLKDPVLALKKEFLAQYVLCEPAPLAGQLLNDSRAHLLARNEMGFLFRLDP